MEYRLALVGGKGGNVTCAGRQVGLTPVAALRQVLAGRMSCQ